MIKKIIYKVCFFFGLTEILYQLQSRYNKDVTFFDDILDAQSAYKYLADISYDHVQSCITNHKYKEPDCDLEVIVPCYNVENFVDECIDSIIEQRTSYSFSVTIINDGSKDNTRKVLMKYENVENVRIIDQENKGLSGARNAGIEQLHGKYVMFVDSDDALLPDAIDHLLSLAFHTNADVVDSGHFRFLNTKSDGFMLPFKAKVYDILQKPYVLPYNENSSWISGYPCGKVFKRELFSKIHFPEGYWFEDTIVWMILEPLCKKKVTTNLLSFKYRMNQNSISHSFTGNLKSLDSIYITLQLLKDRQNLNIAFSQYQYDQMLHHIHNIFIRLSGMSTKIKYASFIIICDIFQKQFVSFNSKNKNLRPIEDFIRNSDFDGFILWNKLH